MNDGDVDLPAWLGGWRWEQRSVLDPWCTIPRFFSWDFAAFLMIDRTVLLGGKREVRLSGCGCSDD